MDQETNILIERYLEGDLSPSELKAFSSRLGSDPEFAAEVRLRRHLDAALGDEDFDRLQAAVNRADARYFEEEKSAPKVRPLWPKFAGAAAAMVALLLVFWFVWSPGPADPAQIFAENFEAYPVYANLRSGNPSDSLMNLAYGLYSDEKYDQAGKAFAQITEAEPNNISANFYLGVSRTASGQFSEAVQPLQRVRQESAHALREPATWYLALVRIQTDKSEMAQPLLQELVDSGGTYRERALDLLEEL